MQGTCARCHQNEQQLHSCQLNVIGIGMWTWHLCTGCQRGLVHAALAAALPLTPDAQEPAPEGGAVSWGGADPELAAGELPALTNPTTVTCEVCGRFTADDLPRCPDHRES